MTQASGPKAKILGLPKGIRRAADSVTRLVIAPMPAQLAEGYLWNATALVVEQHPLTIFINTIDMHGGAVSQLVSF